MAKEGKSAAPTTLRERQKAFTRQQLLDAARAVFAARGYANTKVEDIVARAGTSRATFYMHFESKTQLIAALTLEAEPTREDYWRRLDVALADGSEDALREWFEFALAWWDEHGALVPAWQQASTLEPSLTARSNESLRDIAERLPLYFARVGFADPERALWHVRMLIAQLERFFFRWPVAGISAEDRALITELLTSMWHAAFAPRSSGRPASRS